MYLIPACTELKTDLAVQYVQQAKQVEALIDNLPEKQDVGPIVSKLTTRCELSHRLDTLLCDLLYPIRSRLRYCQNDRLKALDVEMKTANEEYKSALKEAGQSRPVPLNIVEVAEQRLLGIAFNDISQRLWKRRSRRYWTRHWPDCLPTIPLVEVGPRSVELD